MPWDSNGISTCSMGNTSSRIHFPIAVFIDNYSQLKQQGLLFWGFLRENSSVSRGLLIIGNDDFGSDPSPK